MGEQRPVRSWTVPFLCIKISNEKTEVDALLGGREMSELTKASPPEKGHNAFLQMECMDIVNQYTDKYNIIILTLYLLKQDKLQSG